MSTTRIVWGIGATVAAVAALSACGGQQSNSGAAALSGGVQVDGSSTVAPLTSVAAELFAERQPGVKVTVGTSGTGGGFEKFCRGELDIADASRPIEADESQACAAAGIDYQELVVANDALTVVVSKENTFATCLTTAQLAKIWAPDSTVTNWHQVDSRFPDRPLELFGPGTDSGTFDYFTKAITGTEGASRTDYTPSEDDNVIVQGVSGSAGGLGYFGFTYYQENQDKVTAVAIDSGSGCVAPSAASAQDGSYTPLSRPLFIYPSVAKLTSNEALREFLSFYVDNDARIAEDAQFIALNEAQRTELRQAYEQARASAGLASTGSPS